MTTSYTGPKGDKGDKGDAGADAATPNWTLQTSTVAAGGTPTVSDTGTYPNQTITFGLVTGDTGATGSQGNTGPTGPQGTAAGFGTPTITANTVAVDGSGNAQSATASISSSGTDTSKVFDFTLGVPTGATGATGRRETQVIRERKGQRRGSERPQ